MVSTRHDPTLDAPIVREVHTVHGIALKTLRTGDIVTMAISTREVKLKVKGRIKGNQVGGIEDPGAAACPTHKGGNVTKDPREKRVKSLPMGKAWDPPHRLQEWIVLDLTTSFMAAL